MVEKKRKSFGSVFVLILNSVLIAGLVFGFLSYDSGYKRKLYNQNLDEISNINQASANIASTFFSGREAKLRDLALYIEANKCTLQESMDYIYETNSDENRAFEMINTELIGYRIEKNAENEYEALNYSGGYGTFGNVLKENVKETDSQVIRFASEFTDGFTALKSFASYNCVRIKGEGNVTVPYTLMVVSTSDDFINMININSGYEELETAIINQNGDYIIGNSEFKSNNFLDFLKVFNNLSLDRKKEIHSEMKDTQKGSLTYLDGRGRNCVYVYTPVPDKEWYCVTMVPIDGFRNMGTDFSFAFAVAGVMLVLFVIDMAYLFALNQKLRQSVKNERISSAAKTEFLSRMSHDMRTPMNGILGLAELSEEEENTNVLHQNIQRIRESGDYLLSLINDTLDFQRIESGRMNLDKKIVNGETLLRSVVDVVKPSLDRKKIHFEVIREANLNWYVRLDPVRFKQIFINLLSNAGKFTPEGGKVTVTIGSDGQDGVISKGYVRVSDNGLGMSEDFLKHHIFKPFSQESNEVSTLYAGSGLGLSIVKKLVELMGGSIEVESELNKGTTFTVHLDIERVDVKEAEEALELQKETMGDIRDQLKGRKILLVEDHPLNAEIARKLLERSGCIVTWAENGKRAVEIFQSEQEGTFDLMLMDIRMPVMDGIEAAKVIRSLKHPDAVQIPIIAMTANAFDDDVKECLDAGMNAHLGKPIDTKNLYETILHYTGHSGSCSVSPFAEGKSKMD